MERMVAAKAASLIREFVQTTAFDQVVLIRRRTYPCAGKERRYVVSFTPSKGSFLAGIGFWLMLWLGLFKIDELVGDTRLRSWLSPKAASAGYPDIAALRCSAPSCQLSHSWDFSA